MERRREKAKEHEIRAFLSNLSMHAHCSTSPDVERGLIQCGDLNNVNLCSFVLVFPACDKNPQCQAQGKGGSHYIR